MNEQQPATQTDPLLTPEREPKKFTLKNWVGHINDHASRAKLEQAYAQARKHINDELSFLCIKPEEAIGCKPTSFNLTYGSLILRFEGGRYLNLSALDDGELEAGYPLTIEEAIKVGGIIPDGLLEGYEKAAQALHDYRDKATVQRELLKAVKLIGEKRAKVVELIGEKRVREILEGGQDGTP